MYNLAPWRSYLSRALHLHRSQPHSRYLQLATVTRQGFPANRTVVFRGFLENTNQLQIVTDRRSDKIEQIEEQSWGEICWYFPKTREQFRIFGKITLVRNDCNDQSLVKARILAWQKLSDTARQQFAWSTPKTVRVDGSTALQFVKNDDVFDCPLLSLDRPLENFCLLLLDPERVDYLELRGKPHNRSLYLQKDATWIFQSVNP